MASFPVWKASVANDNVDGNVCSVSCLAPKQLQLASLHTLRLLRMYIQEKRNAILRHFGAVRKRFNSTVVVVVVAEGAKVSGERQRKNTEGLCTGVLIAEGEGDRSGSDRPLQLDSVIFSVGSG